MNLVSSSSKRIPAERVDRNNTNIWRYSTTLFAELKKENYIQSDPELYRKYLESVGAVGYSEPFKDIDFKLDVDKFKEQLSAIDLDIFNLMLLGLKHREIKEVVGLSQTAISKRLNKIYKAFREFYYDEE